MILKMKKESLNSENTDLFEDSFQEDKLENLKEEHPGILDEVKKFQDPSLSKKDFFRLIEEFNTRIPGDEKRVGMYKSLTLEVEGVSGRSITVMWFENGRVEISGIDHFN